MMATYDNPPAAIPMKSAEKGHESGAGRDHGQSATAPLAIQAPSAFRGATTPRSSRSRRP
jgi:hypothetical protein